jgi:hypothetical protein
MKLRYIITTLLAAVALATGCQESLERHLAEVQVSSSYVAIPAAGGSKTITVTATSDWAISDIPESWLTVTPTSGVAGETEVTFTAAAATSTNEATVSLVCNEKIQQINVLQMTEKVDLPISTCAEVNAGVDGTSYRIKGTVTKITSTTYGNMYINDGTDEVYVYGTLDANGAEKNFSSLGIEAGDIVTVEGPRKTYSGTIELVNVTVISIEKSLIKVDSLSVKKALPLEGGELKAYLTCKGDGVTVSVPDASKSWISVNAVETSGTSAIVTFYVAANEGGDRSSDLAFSTTSGGKTYTASSSFEQKGAIIDASVAEFLAAAESNTQYRVTGVVTKISASSKYHNADITVSSGDFASSVLLYRTVTSEGNIEDKGIKVGDIVTVLGKRSSYNNTPQMAAGGVCESVKSYAAATVAEFLAAENGSEYAVTGEITKVASLSGKSGYNNVNITIKDGDNTLYLYRVTTYDKADVAALNPEVGGTITVAGKRGEYNGSAQMAAGGVVLAYTAPAQGGATYTLTADALPTAYPTEETTVTLSGLECYILNVANFGYGIQLKKGGAYIANKTALKKIKTIKVTCTDGKTYYPDNVSLYAGSAAKPEGAALTGTSDESSTTFDLSSGNYTYFTIKNASNYAVNFSKIEITCEN